VALSRCRTLNGLVLSTRINQRSIVDDPAISVFVKETEQNQPDQKKLSESKKAYERTLLTELFDFTGLMNTLSYCIKIVRENHESILGNPEEMLENSLTAIKTDLIEVSEKFRPQLNGLLSGETDAESNTLLQDRIKKACDFFSAKLEAALKEILAGFSVETDNKTVRKSVSETLERIAKEGVTKLACLKAAGSGFTIGKYLEAKAKSAIEIPAAKSHSAKSVEDTTGIIQHPALFRQLKEWRNTKAREMDLPHYMILPQKTMVTLANFVPQSLRVLNLVKGMGKKKSERYGEELLEIITSYCEKENIEPPEEALIEKKRLKKIKEDTKKISYDLFKEGKSVSEIAVERSLTEGTIESHLAYYVGTGEIPVSEFVSKETADLIAGHFKGTNDFTIGPVKASLGDTVSWNDIRFVINHLMFLRRSDTGKVKIL
jgi:hypothetical protein